MQSIPNFPHAHYDPVNRLGWLCEYYPFKSIGEHAWRNETYTPELLNFKEGEASAIKYFVQPYLQLLQRIASMHRTKSLTLIPVPSSIPAISKSYTTRPKSKTGKNRDNRNHIFCEFLVKSPSKQSIQFQDILIRTTEKPRKDRWNSQEHAYSLSCLPPARKISIKTMLVLVDDVYTTGGTISGARQVLAEAFPNHTIVALPIARTCIATKFRPLAAFKDVAQ